MDHVEDENPTSRPRHIRPRRVQDDPDDVGLQIVRPARHALTDDPYEAPVADEPLSIYLPAVPTGARRSAPDEEADKDADDLTITTVLGATGDETTILEAQREEASTAAEGQARCPGLGRAIGLTLLSAVIPGLGMLWTPRRRLGALITGVFVTGLATVAAKLHFDLGGTAAIAVQPGLLNLATYLLVALGLFWAMVITGTHLAARPRPATSLQRAVGSLLVGLLSFVVASGSFVGARYAREQASLISTVLQSSKDTRSQTRPTLPTNGDDVWAGKERLNILLVGADSTAYRDEHYNAGIRTDTIMLASIDTRTGNMALIQLPRNMSVFPFPEGSALARAYPNGYWTGIPGDSENPEYELNSVWKNVPSNHPELFTDTDYPGADALKHAVEGITGLKPDYFTMLSIDGLVSLIDAMGGVRVNVNGYIPVAQSGEQFLQGVPPAGGYIAPGENRHLNGYYAMWFARSRSQSADPDRMARQSCVVKQIVDQANPQNLLTHYEAIAKAGKYALVSDIPQEIAPDIIQLALKMKDAKVQRVLFAYPNTTLPNGQLFKPWAPDVVQMRKMIDKAIVASNGPRKQPKKSTGTSAEPSQTATGRAPSASPTPTPTQAPTAPSKASPSKSTGDDDLTDACAWKPEAAAKARANPPRDLQVAGEH